MARILRTKKGRAEWARRRAVAEPPLGQIKHFGGCRQFFLRGMDWMKVEGNLVPRIHDVLR